VASSTASAAAAAATAPPLVRDDTLEVGVTKVAGIAFAANSPAGDYHPVLGDECRADEGAQSDELESAAIDGSSPVTTSQWHLMQEDGGIVSETGLAISGACTSSSGPTDGGSGSAVVQPAGASLSSLRPLLASGSLPSVGTVAHGSSQHQCMVCRPHQRGACSRGPDCHRCHAPHTEEEAPHGGGRSRQRAARLMAEVRRIRTPSP